MTRSWNGLWNNPESINILYTYNCIYIIYIYICKYYVYSTGYNWVVTRSLHQPTPGWTGHYSTLPKRHQPGYHHACRPFHCCKMAVAKSAHHPGVMRPYRQITSICNNKRYKQLRNKTEMQATCKTFQHICQLKTKTGLNWAHVISSPDCPDWWHIRHILVTDLWKGITSVFRSLSMGVAT